MTTQQPVPSPGTGEGTRSYRFIAILFAGLILFPLHVYSSLSSRTPEEAAAYIDELVQKKQIGKETTDELIAVLKSADSPVQLKERAAWALGQLDVKSAVPDLITAAKHKGLLVRSAALDSLTRMRSRSALPVFVSIAKSDPVMPMRQRATLALGLLQWEKTIPTLVELSEDSSPEVRGASALSMAATHSKKNDFSVLMKEMQQDQNPYVQERSKIALDIINRKTTSLQSYLKSNDADARLFAALYFHQNGTSKDRKTLETAMNGEAQDEVRYEMELAVKAIKKRAADAAAAAEKAKKAAASKPAAKKP